MRPIFAVFALFAALLVATTATAAQLPSCKPAQEATEELHKLANDNNAVFLNLDRAQTKRLMDVVNSAPPETDFEGDAAVVIVLQSMKGAVFLRNGDQLCGFLRLSAEGMQAALKAAIGTAS